MKTLKALTPNQVDAATQEIFGAITKKVGMLPNLYAAMGNSPQLLKGFLTFEDTLKQGEFTAKENEVIALTVSQINNCNYCLAAHSAIGKMVGFSETDVLEIRKETIADEKLKALISLAGELVINRGNPSQASIDNFLSAGYSAKAFAELIGMVAIRSITNAIFSNGDFEIDFPKAKRLDELVTA